MSDAKLQGSDYGFEVVFFVCFTKGDHLLFSRPTCLLSVPSKQQVLRRCSDFLGLEHFLRSSQLSFSLRLSSNSPGRISLSTVLKEKPNSLWHDCLSYFSTYFPERMYPNVQYPFSCTSLFSFSTSALIAQTDLCVFHCPPPPA